MDFKTFTRASFLCREGWGVWLPHRTEWPDRSRGACLVLLWVWSPSQRQVLCGPSSVTAGQHQPDGAQILPLQSGEEVQWSARFLQALKNKTKTEPGAGDGSGVNGWGTGGVKSWGSGGGRQWRTVGVKRWGSERMKEWGWGSGRIGFSGEIQALVKYTAYHVVKIHVSLWPHQIFQFWHIYKFKYKNNLVSMMACLCVFLLHQRLGQVPFKGQ